MTHTFRILVIALLLPLLAGSQARASAQGAEQKVQEVELPAELARVLRDYEGGWSTRDADALSALFTEDGFILRPRQVAVRGRAAIREAYTNAGGPLVLRAYSYEVGTSIGYIIGGFALAPDGPDVGKFILTLRKEGEHWMITADMDNGNR